jgi:acetyltransferase-like isoleucine patch superfamily enzyme
MHNFNLIYTHFVRTVLYFLPDAPILMRFRGWMYSFVMHSCGRNFQVASTAVLRGLEKISCGDDVYIAPNAYLLARVKIELCSEVLIAINVVLVDGNHGKDATTNSYRFIRGRQEAIVVGMGSWVAANSVVTAGSVIRPGSFVPACTVVRKGVT